MSGAPSEVYTNNIEHIWISLAFVYVCAATSSIYIPVFYELKVKSCHEYLQLRFNRTVRTVVFVFFTLHMVIYMSLVLYTPSVAISGVTGLHMWSAVVSVTVVCTLYVTIGGIKAVIWTDFFQMIVMYLTLVIAILKARSVVGTKNMLESAERTERAVLYDSSMWVQIFGGGFGFLGLYAVNHAQVHRCLTCVSLKEAKMAIWMSLPGQIFFLSMCALLGLYMSAFYENCDPLQAKLVEKPSEMVPLFMQDILSDSPGLMGLFLAGIFSATLSTVSSCLNSLAMVMIQDGIRVHFKARVRKERERLLSQILSIIFGFVCLELTILAAKLGQDVVEVAVEIHGCVYGPVLGVFTLGMLIPWANEKGALAGICGAMGLNVVFLIFSKKHELIEPLKCVSNCNVNAFSNMSRKALVQIFRNFDADGIQNQKHFEKKISTMWFSLWSFISCILIGIVVSYVTGFQDPKKVDPRLIVPVFDVCFPLYYLPESLRERLRFGIDHEMKNEKARPKVQSVTNAITQPSAVSLENIGVFELPNKYSVCVETSI